MQELQTKRKNGKVIDTEFIIWALSRLAGEISSILDGLPLTLDRAFRKCRITSSRGCAKK
ncbi:terminase small subunit [Klebsiella quasipneumoniae]|uniref:terminase small subunit n=2 Tax=Klebsiella/Raoultella group TaxID=2890311 RepID=UPI0035CCDDF8